MILGTHLGNECSVHGTLYHCVLRPREDTSDVLVAWTHYHAMPYSAVRCVARVCCRVYLTRRLARPPLLTLFFFIILKKRTWERKERTRKLLPSLLDFLLACSLTYSLICFPFYSLVCLPTSVFGCLHAGLFGSLVDWLINDAVPWEWKGKLFMDNNLNKWFFHNYLMAYLWNGRPPDVTGRLRDSWAKQDINYRDFSVLNQAAVWHRIIMYKWSNIIALHWKSFTVMYLETRARMFNIWQFHFTLFLRLWIRLN